VKIFVTGVGIVTAIGLDAREIAFPGVALNGISRSNKNDLMLGEVRLSNEALMEHFYCQLKTYSRTSLLGCVQQKKRG
jgi:hypothetical protein